MIPLHCLWGKSNNRTRGQLDCDANWLCFCFDFVLSHALCGCYSIVCWKRWREEWGCLKLNVQVQGGGKILDVDGQGLAGVEGGFLKVRQFSWTSYVYRPLTKQRVSSKINFQKRWISLHVYESKFSCDRHESKTCDFTGLCRRVYSHIFCF